MTLTYSVVIPVFNSNRSLPVLVKGLREVFNSGLTENYEIIFVDDCSTRPETWEMLKSLVKDDHRIRIFRLARNVGKPGAVICGLSRAKGEWIILMDDDLQHRPEDIPLLISRKEHDVVIARFSQKKCGYFKRWTSDLKGWLDSFILGKPSHISASPFKLINRRVAKAIIGIRTPNPFIMALILHVTSDIVNVDVVHEPRRYGKSQYTLKKALSQFSNMIFNNSLLMLKVMSLIGFGMAASSGSFGIFLILRWFFAKHAVAGWTSLMVMLLSVTGIIMFCLGILGEYLARLISTAEKRPTYVIQESVEAEEEAKSCTL